MADGMIGQYTGSLAYWLHGDQVKVQVIQLQQDTEQLCLVAHEAGERGFAIRLVIDGERRKPFGQCMIEMTFDPDLVGNWHCFHANSITINRMVCRLP